MYTNVYYAYTWLTRYYDVYNDILRCKGKYNIYSVGCIYIVNHYNT